MNRQPNVIPLLMYIVDAIRPPDVAIMDWSEVTIPHDRTDVIEDDDAIPTIDCEAIYSRQGSHASKGWDTPSGGDDIHSA